MNIENFRVPQGKTLNLEDHPTNFTGDYTDKKQAVKDLKSNIKKLDELQSVLYAEDVHSILIIFQAMDAAGKDGAIKHVMSGLNPQGTQVFSFKQPSSEELDHGYLWRCMKAFRNVVASGFLIVRITKTFSSFVFIRKFCNFSNFRPPSKTIRISGIKDLIRLKIWKNISPKMEYKLSNFF